MVKVPHDSLKYISVIWLLAALVSVAILSITVFPAAGSPRVEAPLTLPANSCDSLKGKTYIAFTVGKFDSHPNAAAAGKWTFDNEGRATGRSLIVYEPTDQIVVQQLPTATCTLTSDGIGMLNFMVGSTSAGSAKFWPYDNGARLWVEPTTPGRPMNGWLLQLPQPPSQIQ